MPNSQANAVLHYLRKVTTAQYALNLSDQELLNRFTIQRDVAAFQALVRRHGPMVLHRCQRVLQDKDDAEDAFQATFLVLCQKADSLHPQKSLAGWLHSVSYRIAQKARIAAARRRKHEGHPPDRQATDPLAEITLREAHEILDQELLRLPDKFRAPLVLCYLEGLSREEAAQQLGWPPATLKSRLEQARDRLRGRLASRGLALSSALVASLFYEGTVSGAVPAVLLDSTLRAATLVAAGDGVTAGVVSVEVVALMKGATKAMLLGKLKFASVVMLVLCLAGIGASVLTYQALAAGTSVADALAQEKATTPAADKALDVDQSKGGDQQPDGEKPREKDKVTAQPKVTLTGKVSKEEREVPAEGGGATTSTRYHLTEVNGNRVQLPPPRKNEAGELLDHYQLEDFVGQEVNVAGRAVIAGTGEAPDSPTRVVRLLAISEIKLVK